MFSKTGPVKYKDNIRQDCDEIGYDDGKWMLVDQVLPY